MSSMAIYKIQKNRLDNSIMKLLNDLVDHKDFSEHRKLNILNEEKLTKINKEFQILHKEWRFKNNSNKLNRSIINSMHKYSLKLKFELNLALEMAKNSQKILDEVQDTEEEMYAIDIKITNKNYAKEIEIILEKIKQYDELYYLINKEKFEKFSVTTIEQKLKLFYDNLKLEYGKIKVMAIWTNIYKESLLTFKNEEPIKNDPNLTHSIDSLLDQNQISENMYDQLYHKIQVKLTSAHEQQEKSLEADKIVTALEKLNYLVIDNNKENIVDKLSKKEKVELAVKDKDYMVVVRFNNDNNLLTRFVRVVGDKKDIERLSSSEKLKDTENLKKWCKHQKDFMRYINHNGLDIDQTIVEDDENELLYVVDVGSKKEQQKNIQKKEGDMYNG